MREHNAAVVAFLRAQTLIAGAQARIGDAQRPAVTTTPYAIVYPVDSGTFAGPIADPQADAYPASQVTCVGVDRNEAEGLADSIRTALLTARTLAIPGRALLGPVEQELSRFAQPDDSGPQTLYFAVDIYRARTTPA